MTNIKEIQAINQKHLTHLIATGNVSSWHDDYRSSAYIHIGGLPKAMTEGDIVAMLSQYGTVVDIHLIRGEDRNETQQERDTPHVAPSKGFAFVAFEDQRSTDLAVDNLNGYKLLDRILRVDHVKDYKAPRLSAKATDEEWNAFFELHEKKQKWLRAWHETNEMEEKRKRKEERARIRMQRAERRARRNEDDDREYKRRSRSKSPEYEYKRHSPSRKSQTRQ